MLTLKANAKINLTLDILGKRDDGYHEVAMIMQSLDLADEVTLEKTDSGIELSVSGADLSVGEDNLAHKAAQVFFREQNLQGGIRIHIEKRIPMAAGLAGGSSDGAAVMRGLNLLYEKNLPPEELCTMGEKFGSDVPFCIMGGTMLATGRGEKLKRLPDFAGVFVVLAKPPADVSTAWAYKTYDAAPPKEHPDNVAMEQALAAKDLALVAKLLGNVLEPITAKEHPVIEKYRKQMLAAGAMAARMSGSGPTVFALARDESGAKKILSALKKEKNARLFLCKTIGQK